MRTTGLRGWTMLWGVDLTPRSRYRRYIEQLERVVRSRSDEDNLLRGQLDQERNRVGHLCDYVRELEQTNDLLNDEVIRLRAAFFRHRSPDGRFISRKARAACSSGAAPLQADHSAGAGGGTGPAV